MKPRVAYLLGSLDMGGMASFARRLAEQTADQFSFYFIATHVERIAPAFHDLGQAVYLGQEYRLIKRYLREQHIDMVQYAHEREFGDAALAAGVPVVIERTDGNRGGAALKPKHGLDAVIISTRGLHAPTTRLIDPARVHLIYNGVDLIHLQNAQPDRLGLAPDAFIVGRVSRFVPGKNLSLLIEAFRLLKPRWPQAHLVLVGGNSNMPGAADEEAHLRAAAHGLEGCVHFTGPVEDPAPLIRGFDAATCTSLPGNEGIPNSLLEPMGCGIPVVSTAVDDIPELITHGQNGLLVPSGDAAALAAALEQLMAHPELCQRLGRAAQQHIAADFDITRQAARYAELYHRLLADRLPADQIARRARRYTLHLEARLAARALEPIRRLGRRARGKLRLMLGAR